MPILYSRIAAFIGRAGGSMIPEPRTVAEVMLVELERT